MEAVYGLFRLQHFCMWVENTSRHIWIYNWDDSRFAYPRVSESMRVLEMISHGYWLRSNCIYAVCYMVWIGWECETEQIGWQRRGIKVRKIKAFLLCIARFMQRIESIHFIIHRGLTLFSDLGDRLLKCFGVLKYTHINAHAHTHKMYVGNYDAFFNSMLPSFT